LTKALTAKRIESAPSGPVRKEIPDGLLVGLYLVVQPSGTKSFAVRYRYASQPRKLTLGAFPALSLEVARDLGGKALRAAAEGRDPANEKQAAKNEARKAETDAVRSQRDLYENVAREFIERHAMKSNRASTWRETARILGLRPTPGDPSLLADIGGDVMSAWRGRRIQEITKRDVIALLDHVNDRGSPIMANRVLSAVRKLFNWCVSRDVLQGSPCTLISPPAPERSRDRILDDSELRRVWNAAEAEGWPFGPLIKLLILTGQRVSEVGGMRWNEINKDQRLWTLPAERVKNGVRHEVPLSDAAMVIIGTLPHIKTTKGFIFTTRRDAAVSGFSRAKDSLDAAIAAALPEAQPLNHWTFHDLRRTTASGMARLGIQIPVIEKILNHSSGTFRGIVGVYQRHSYSEEKRKALDVWATFVQSVVAGRALTNVVSLKGRPDEVA
jgi:integrase